MDKQQKVLDSPFDLETHKKTFINYLEVIIDFEGNVMYAVPSHQQAMIRIATEKLNVTEERLFEMYASSGCDTIEWLSGITGCISVWFDNYVGEPNEKQLEVLRKFREEGIYIGPTYNKYVKHDTVKEMLNVVYGSPHRNTDIYESLSLSSRYIPPRIRQSITDTRDKPYLMIDAMRPVSADIFNAFARSVVSDKSFTTDSELFEDETVKGRTLNLQETSMKNNVHLDTDMCYNIYEMFSESKKFSLKSVVEWSRECDRIDYTKDVKISFRFPLNNKYGHIAELTSYALNDIIFNQNNKSVRQRMFTERKEW